MDKHTSVGHFVTAISSKLDAIWWVGHIGEEGQI